MSWPAGGSAPGGRDDMRQRAATSPLRRAPEEIAPVVAFLLSDESANMTGEVVFVDGGATITSTVHPSVGAGAWDFESLDRRTYPGGRGRVGEEGSGA